MRILIIEDEPELARHIRAALIRHGHPSEVEANGAVALQLALKDQPDLILLDINLPAMDGFEVLTRLRQAKCPAMVLMLTARGEVYDRIKGLKAGADDYLAKPFAIEELIARVEALGRRGGAPLSGTNLQIADLHMNVPQRHVTRSGQAIALSPREFDLLQVLMQEPGRIFARTELRDRVWQGEQDYDVRIIDMFITRLRKKIDAGFDPALIHTLRNVGYTLRLPA
ncbi:response regulator transcription factor [Horticoccus sp. 23ND18S-11]|uniref:response regulator transcription factor n=1 Tax=Horticoccus sp. 23ND18S-11 TaxID=3391832 RepID=UPI0039C9675D